jgi:hypothetical protein
LYSLKRNKKQQNPNNHTLKLAGDKFEPIRDWTKPYKQYLVHKEYIHRKIKKYTGKIFTYAFAFLYVWQLVVSITINSLNLTLGVKIFKKILNLDKMFLDFLQLKLLGLLVVFQNTNKSLIFVLIFFWDNWTLSSSLMEFLVADGLILLYLVINMKKYMLKITLTLKR